MVNAAGGGLAERCCAAAEQKHKQSNGNGKVPAQWQNAAVLDDDGGTMQGGDWQNVVAPPQNKCEKAQAQWQNAAALDDAECSRGGTIQVAASTGVLKVDGIHPHEQWATTIHPVAT